MTDTAPNELNEAGLSRRRALQAGVGAGIGLVAWSGATITSMGGTPAYAEACTNFTLDFSATDMSTNQSDSTCTIRYNNSPPLDVKVKGYGFPDVPNGGNFACANDRNCYTFTFPSDETCTVTIKIHRNHFSDATVIFGATTTNTGSGGTMHFCLPTGNPASLPPTYGSQDPSNGFSPAFLGDNVSPTFWSVHIQCVKTSQAGCLTSTTASPN